MYLMGKKRWIRIVALMMSVIMVFSIAIPQQSIVFAATKTPAKVSSVKMTTRTPYSLTIKWGKATNATKYRIAYKKSSWKEYKYKTVTGTTYKLSGLDQNSTYSVKVRGLNQTKEGSYSSVKKYTTSKEKTPLNVKNVKMTTRTPYSLTIKWDKATNATNYRIAYKKSSWKDYKYKTVTGTTYKLSGLDQNTAYSIKVRGLNQTKKGSYSSVTKYSTLMENTPSKVQELKLAASTSDSLTISWKKASDATAYQIAYKMASWKDYKYTTVTATTYKLSNLSSATEYIVKVRGINQTKKGTYSSSKRFNTMNKVVYSAAKADNTVQIQVREMDVKISVSKLASSGSADLYSVDANAYMSGDDIRGLVVGSSKGKKLGTVKLSQASTITIPRFEADGYDNLYSKYYLIQSGKILKGPIYATDVHAYGNKTMQDVISKKGIVWEDSNSIDIAKDLGANWTAVNINFTELVRPNETRDGKKLDNSVKNCIDFESNGKTYYFNSSYVNMLDSEISNFSRNGINVIGVVIAFVSTDKGDLEYPAALRYIDDARWTEAFNTSNELGRNYFIATMEFLAERYSKSAKKGLVTNYVIGNEIDYAYDWNEIIPNKSTDGKPLSLEERATTRGLRSNEEETRAPFDTYMEEYERTLRLANLAIKKYAQDATVGVSLTKNWAKSIGDQRSSNPKENKSYDSYAPKEILDWLNYYTKKRGDYDWTISQHYYPLSNRANLAAVETGLDKEYSIEDPISGDYRTEEQTSENAIEMVQKYLDLQYTHVDGNHRSIYMTETGTSSGTSINPSNEELMYQAAATAQLYYRAASLPAVKAVVFYKIQDRVQEGSTSYKLGLLDVNGNKKPSYNVWKYIDTSKSFNVANKYLKYISFKKDGKEYSVAAGTISSYRDVMEMVDTGFDWDKAWDIDKLTPVKLDSDAQEKSLFTDTETYGADDEILVTATGSSTDLVGLFKKGEDAKVTPIYSYSIGEDGIQSGKTYDIRAYGEIGNGRRDDAKLPAGEYTVILSSVDEIVKSIDITITGESNYSDEHKTVTTNKTTYRLGEDIIVTASGTNSDWVGIYKQNEIVKTHESIYWYYVTTDKVSGKPMVIQNGKKNVNSSNPQAVIQPGTYKVVLMEDDGYNILAQVDNITIEAGVAEKLTSISYDLYNETDGYANGKVTITKSSDSSATDCIMYWADQDGKPLEGYTALAKFKLTGTTTIREMAANTIIPPGAKKLIAYAVSGGQTSTEAVYVDLPDNCNYVMDSDTLTEFAVVSDLHIVNSGEGDDYGNNNNQHFVNLLKDIKKELPNSSDIFINGDIADRGKASQYKTLMNLWKNTDDTNTLHMAIGNHDWITNNPNNQFQKYVNWFNPSVQPQKLYYDEWVNGYHYIYLASEGAGTNAWLSDAQLEWFDNLLMEDTKYDQDSPVFVFLHEGVKDSVAGNYVDQWGYFNGVNQEAKLKKILKKYGQIIMFGGHTHYDLNTDYTMNAGEEDMPVYFNTASVSYLWSAYNYDAGEFLGGSQGYYTKVFDDKIYMFGRDYVTGEYIPSAMFVIERMKLDVPKTKISMNVGDNYVNIKATTEDGQRLTYSSSNSKVVAVDSSGNLRAVGSGTAQITVSTQSSNTKVVNRKVITVTVQGSKVPETK